MKSDTPVFLKNINNLALENKDGAFIKHKYNIPHYQRGYRWEDAEVLALLNDIWDFLNQDDDRTERYCLQPIVLKPKDRSIQKGFIQGRDNQEYTLCTWDVIDGQQRLSTLYLIMQYLSPVSSGEIYEMSYSVRNTDAKMLEWRENLAEYNPRRPVAQPLLEYNVCDDLDVYYMAKAVKCIDNWFFEKAKENTDRNPKQTFIAFRERVHVIWYEIESSDNDTDAIDMFTRLNIGKIPLTDAELIKAILLRQGPGQDERIQRQRAFEWDQIELSLSDDEFFYFLCDTVDCYETRIDYLFWLNYVLLAIENQQAQTLPDYYGLFFFYANRINDTASDVWKEIKTRHLLLCQWYKNNDIYHKIGYLIACCRFRSKSKNASLHLMAELISKYNSEKSKKAFLDSLNDCISETVADFYPKMKHTEEFLPLNELSFSENNDAIEQLLLLFNIVSAGQSPSGIVRFSFNRFLPKTKREEWSLEHICPQHPEECNTLEKQKAWIAYCLNELNTLQDSNISTGTMQEDCNLAVAELEKAAAALRKAEAAPISPEGISKLAESYSKVGSELSIDQDLHKISNLALLPRGTNSKLSNALFFQKRRMVMKADKNGDFIPLCTHNVFLKYYSEKDTHLYFWTENDRDSYYDAMARALKPYLPKEDAKYV